jgi:hypothetical protein
VARRILRLKPALLGLAFVAMLLRMLVPAGFMIASSATGAPTLVLCDGFAPPAAVEPVRGMAGMHHSPRHEPDHRREAPCPYAAMAAPVLPPLPVPFGPPTPAAPASLAPFFARAVADPAAILPPSTGPPHAA